jgi:excisionase family DNA binding protein
MEKLLSAKEKAAQLGINLRTLYRKAEKNEIQFKRYGRMFRFYETDPPQKAPRTLIIEAPPSFNLKDFDRMYLKKEVKMSRSKKRWNYGKRGVFLRELPSGKEYWYYWLTDGQGKRIVMSAKGATSRAEAVLVMEHAYREQFKKNYLPDDQEIKDITFSEFAKEYLELVKNTKKSWKGDESVLNCGLLRKFGNKKLSEIQPKHVEDYINYKLENVDRGTTNIHASLLRRMINKAKQRGYRVPETNPVIHREHIKEVDARDRTLTFEEEERLLAHLPEKLKPIVVTALHTGMRKKEILNLEWRDVDLDYRRIHIRAEKSKTHQDRHIPIDNVLLSLLEELHMNNSHSEYVFTKNGANPYADIQEGFAKARSEAGIKDLYFHDLRHTFATRAVKAGVDLFSLMKFLGHKDVTTTQRYVNLRDVDLLPAIEKLERYCDRSRKKMSQKRIQPEEMTEIPSYAM